MSVKEFYSSGGATMSEKQALEESLPYVLDAILWCADELQKQSDRIKAMKAKGYEGLKPKRGEWPTVSKYLPSIPWEDMPATELGFIPTSVQIPRWNLATWNVSRYCTNPTRSVGKPHFNKVYSKTIYNNDVPILCHPDMGWIFYVNGLNIFGGYAVPEIYHSLRERGTGHILCVNWITGSTHIIGHISEGIDIFPDRFSYRRFEKHAFSIPEFAGADMERSDVYSLEELTLAHEVFEKFLEENRAEIATRDLISEERLTDMVNEILERGEKAGVSVFPNLDPNYVENVISNWDICNFVEEIFSMKPGSLMYSYAPGVSYSVGNLYHLLRFTGPHFQEFLNTSSQSKWFLENITNSIRKGKTTIGDISNIPSWLGISRKDFRELIAEPDEKRFLVFLACNMFKKTSREEFERLYARTKDVIASIGSEASRGSYSFSIKNRRGKILFRSQNIPEIIDYFVKNKVYKTDSLNHFVKYFAEEYKLIQKISGAEIKAALASATVSYGYYYSDPLSPSYCYTILEKLLCDYQRLVRTVMPGAAFAMPHNVVKAHQNMVDNVNRILADRMECGVETEDLMMFARCYSGTNAAVYSDEKYVVIAPESSLDLYDEGIQLNHCIGTYGSLIASKNGSMLIFFLRYATSPGKPLVSMQIDKDAEGKWVFTERAGEGNRLLNAAETEFADKWLDAFNRDYAESRKKRTSAPVVEYDIKIVEWLRMSGMSTMSMPTYRPSEDVETNYRRLFEFAIPNIVKTAFISGSYTEAWKTAFVKGLAKVSGRLRKKSLFEHGKNLVEAAVSAAA